MRSKKIYERNRNLAPLASHSLILAQEVLSAKRLCETEHSIV